MAFILGSKNTSKTGLGTEGLPSIYIYIYWPKAQAISASSRLPDGQSGQEPRHGRFVLAEPKGQVGFGEVILGEAQHGLQSMRRKMAAGPVA